MQTSDLDFDLPPERIAQAPSATRSASRLLHYRRTDRSITHRQFSDLPSLLRSGDLLVFNNARVLPARFTLIKPTGGRVDGLFVSELRPGRWSVLLKSLGPVKLGTELRFDADENVVVRLAASNGEGSFDLELLDPKPAEAVLERVGRMPLPPYIKRDRQRDERDDFDRQRYQTVYAQAGGSVAAPTAGLHFDEALLAALDKRGIERTSVTLHVGLGTFKPVSADSLEGHAMHVERYTIPAAAADAINAAKQQGRRVIAVGTTAARVLESQPADQLIAPRDGETGIFIYPPYRWKFVDALITNFHLPRSTLIALVAAFVGLDEQRGIYAEAIAQKYNFFSYGDSSFLE